ncbi:MAG: lysylphosphatidylglycerol synthetase family protein [Rhodospirillaceae bacterium]|nr:lysylphosphatidylglycerol synthetase family protein [Rhodospirillaceae bacterium]
MRWVGTIISVVLLGAAIWVLDDLLRTVQFADVMAEFAALPVLNIAIAVGLTVLSYVILITYDLQGLKHIERTLPLLRVAVTSFTSYVFAHNIGFGVITGGSVRYRLYSTAGLSAIDIATVSIFCGLTFTIGIVAMGGVALLAEPASVISALPDLPTWFARVLGVVCIALVAGYLILCIVAREPLNIRGTEFRMPRVSLGFAQLAASVLDITVAAFAMYALMPELSNVSPLAFLGIYVLAILAGVISNVPGGVGIIETALVLLLPGQPTEVVLAGALAYRVIYYLLPLGVAVVMVLVNEAIENAQLVKSVGKTLGGLFIRFAPQLSGILVMVAGLVLLISGASPAIATRLRALGDAVPLALVEASHMLASVIGLLLLIVARGLFRRLDAGYYFAMLALAAGAVFSLLKGFDYEEALLLGMVMALLFVSLRPFTARPHYFLKPSHWDGF